MSKDSIEEVVVPCSLQDSAICTKTCSMYETKFFYTKCFPNYKSNQKHPDELGDSGIYFDRPKRKD